MTRYERSMRRNTFRKKILVLMLFIVPLFAVAGSYFFMSIYDGNGSIDAAADQADSKAVFKYNTQIEGGSLYRLELKSSSTLAEAEEFLDGIKSKKLNGFILKEDGYKVIYGIFTNKDMAASVQDVIAKKAEGSVTETRLPGIDLKYDDKDNAFIQLVQATDKLIWDMAAVKSELSVRIAEKPKEDNSQLVAEIKGYEDKLQRYLGYAEKVAVSKYQEAFRDQFVVMLEEILGNRLSDSKNYFKVQGGFMNQVESYRRYSEGQ